MRSILGDIEENVNDDSLNILYKLYDRIFDYHNYMFNVKIVNTIKSIYNIELNNKEFPSVNRNDSKFNYYNEMIWRDLDSNE